MAIGQSVNSQFYSQDFCIENLYKLHELNLGESLEKTIQEQADSVACMMPDHKLNRINNQGFITYKFDTERVRTLGERISKKAKGIPLGHTDSFLHEPTPGLSTAFLVAPQHVVTVAHCVTRSNPYTKLKPKKARGVIVRTSLKAQSELERIKFVFGFQMKSQNMRTEDYEFCESDVYSFKKVVFFNYTCAPDYLIDWALIKLDREVIGRPPLAVNFIKKSLLNKKIFMLGHPRGLPLKIHLGASVKKECSDQHIETNLDSFHGNSGSPVIDENLEVVSILFAGNVSNKPWTTPSGYEASTKMNLPTNQLRPNPTNRTHLCQTTHGMSFVKIHLKKLKLKKQNKNLETAELSEMGAHYLNFYLSICISDQEDEAWICSVKAKAFKYLSQAAIEDHREALCNLGICYERSLGTRRDLRKAFECFKKSFDNGYKNAAYHLFQCYESGIGTEKDSKLAQYYFDLAHAFGHKDVIKIEGPNCLLM
ncbi:MULTISPECIES: bifunctional trypsin-like peptidase domain-containing/SEL1-like repeat protein [unclassified Neochlamydia]|uniref:bifunctional trypsin-like peptidase domain-containing/SEL1-like repeat protein n=1 Tax=unclassified Neochlamydia TaxID=2643326 RepID=UPI00140ACF59|nr:MULTISPECIES: bifunctional trypsin-like peptidase domain-containing/SEL1-like repeat protein [unclassified Neochlamydia]MBS4165709.1 Uncharacterized protein [Neochlamydia sp. AcF65]MBS4170077.1 Uncharacterized protein [Neochlamydia sp. AcF95]NGY95319.1 hypothetical protein [Neochlamydia sp. AcF84]